MVKRSDERLSKILRTVAITLAVLSGMCALAALAAGSPLQFGVALALCAAGWIAVDFVDRRPERTPVSRLRGGYASPRLVYVGGRERLSRPAPDVAVTFTPGDRRDFAVRAA